MSKLRAAIVAVVVILPLDIGLAQFCRANCEFWQYAYPEEDHRIRSEAYHHTFAPNRRINEAWGLARYRYATNALGFKDAAPRPVPLEGDRPRVLFLGDSFTEGKGFRFQDTFVGLVSRALAKRGIEVLNGGVDSYAPAIYRLKAKHLLETTGLRFETCVVFLDVSDVPDEAERYTFDDDGALVIEPEAEPPLWVRAGRVLRDHSAVGRLASLAYDHIHHLYRATRRRVRIADEWEKSYWDVDGTDVWVHAVTGLDASAWTYDDERWRRYGVGGRARAAADMDGLLEVLSRHGVQLILAVYPWPDQLFHDAEAARYQEFWRRWSAAREVPFLSLFPAFTKGPPREVLVRYFIPFDFHWNAEGHRLVADAFLRRFYPSGPR